MRSAARSAPVKIIGYPTLRPLRPIPILQPPLMASDDCGDQLTVLQLWSRLRSSILSEYFFGKRSRLEMTTGKSLVFLIDDDASVRKGVARLLRAAGYESEIFASASDFLTRPPHSGPSCVIVHVQMPGINGMDLQKELIQRRREEQLVFIAGHGDIPMCSQAMKAGAVDFLPKPLHAEELLQCVQNALIRSAEQRRRSVEKNEARRLLDLLTPREFELLQLVITGMLNKQIAGELGIS